MIKYIVKRLISCVLVLVALSFLAFLVLNLTPGDNATSVLTHTFIGFDDPVYEDDLAAVSNIYGLNQPLIQQYWNWLSHAFTGDFGTSYVYNRPVMGMVLGKLPWTLLLGFGSFAASFLIAVPLGVLLAKHRNGILDHICRVLTIAMGSMPGFWVALMLVIVFSIWLGWLPVYGVGSPLGVILPGVTLMIGMLPTTLRITRSSMGHVLGQDYMLTAISKGMHPRQAVWKHGVRNAMTPVVTIAGLQIGHILGGSVIVENIFAWPGIGKLLYDSIMAKDVPMLQGCIIMIALGYVIGMFLVDLANAVIDPRMRVGGVR